MKRIFVFGLLTLSLLASCKKEESVPKGLPERLVLRVDSETILPTDTIIVYDSNCSAHKFITSEATAEKAVYIAEKWSGEKPSYAINFPGQFQAVCSPEGKVKFNIPAEQKVGEELSVSPNAWATAGKVTTADGNYFLKLREVKSFIKVIIDRDDVAEVRLKGLKGEMIAGDFEVDIEQLIADSVSFWKAVGGGMSSDEVRIIPTGTAVDGENFKQGYYYVSILPQTFGKGLELTMIDKNGNPVSENTICPLMGLSIKRNESVMYNVVEDLFPDTVEFDIDFYNKDNINPFGFTSPQNLDPQNGETYKLKYDFVFNDQPLNTYFDFVFCKGTETGADYKYYPASGMVYGVQGRSILNFVKDKWWIKLPAIPNRYLKSVTVSHGNAYKKRVYIYTGAGATGSVCSYTSNDATAIASKDKLNTETMSFPNELQYAAVHRTSVNTSYYLTGPSGCMAIRIYHLKIVYTRTLE